MTGIEQYTPEGQSERIGSRGPSPTAAVKLPITLDHPIERRLPFSDVPATGGLQSGSATLDVSALSQLFEVRFTLTQHMLARLFQLWNALLLAQADEMTCWSSDAVCEIVLRYPINAPVPTITSVGVTVFASGEVAGTLHLQGVVGTIWLEGALDLTEFEA